MELRHQDPVDLDRAISKTGNKIKISLDSLERLGVSLSAQGTFRRGTGQVIPSFAGGAAIQRLLGILGLVRGHLVRGTSVGRGLPWCIRRTNRNLRWWLTSKVRSLLSRQTGQIPQLPGIIFWETSWPPLWLV